MGDIFREILKEDTPQGRHVKSFVEKGLLCKSNADLVEKAVKIAKLMGREIATPDEARKILELKGSDKVNY